MNMIKVNIFLDITTSLPPPAVTFLVRHGYAGVELELFIGDASTRRNFCLTGRGCLLMDDRQDTGGFENFLRLSNHLGNLSLSAPKAIGADPSNCLALIEDFGDETYAACLNQGKDATELYSLAVDALLHRHHQTNAAEVPLPKYNIETYLDEVDLLSKWFAPALVPQLDVERLTKHFRQLWREALQPITQQCVTLVLRDFHVDNLILLHDRERIKRCGLLDFRDGVIDLVQHDLVSLLRDARRDLPQGLEVQMLTRYLKKMSEKFGTPKVFGQRYLLSATQRHARIIGVFVRLCQRDVKPHYLNYLSRVLQQLKKALIHGGWKAITSFMDAELPNWADCGAMLVERLQPTKAFHHDRCN